MSIRRLNDNPGEPEPLIQAARSLMRRGRFIEAVSAIESLPSRKGSKEGYVHILPLLADGLQRIGENDRAEELASRHLTGQHAFPEISARHHFVLGNVHRERGTFQQSIEHLETSVNLAGTDTELACWAQLRLMATMAEFRGIDAAINRLSTVRRVLARYGEPRPFAALHIWLAEIESTRGYPANARRHLSRATALLSQVEDIWLQGYLAINSSAVSYYCADIETSQHCAERALFYADTSGHRATRRAANANLGHLELSRGNFDKAEKYFETALAHCEPKTVGQIAVLDSIAQAKLRCGDLDGCEEILGRIESLSREGVQAKIHYYQTWALQTRIQVLLKRGRLEQARELIRRVTPDSDLVPQPRVSTVSYLVAAEALVTTGDAMDSAKMLSAVMSPKIQLPPDLHAQMEHVIGHTLRVGGDAALASAHFGRAVQTFEAIGQHVGRSTSSIELDRLTSFHTESTPHGMRLALDHIRALMDLRGRPELFAREAAELLRQLHCAENVTVTASNETASATRRTTDEMLISIDIHVNATDVAHMTLGFTPRHDARSIVTCLEFRRVIEQIISIDPPELPFGSFDVGWEMNDVPSSEGIIFAAECMANIVSTVKKIAPTKISVLITGETGVGKEVIAKKIHEQSLRAALPFVALNCAAIPKELLESQLFGFRRGAFSGAAESFQGVVRAANGGTLFLDEIAELPLDAQAKLLRFLEEGEVHPIGEAIPSKVDVRTLFATNDDLSKAVKDRRFREDLFYRMNVITVRVPPLRERRIEIPLLVSAFSSRFAREFAKEVPIFTSSAMEILILHSWPGNVRQLSNEVRRITALVQPGEHVTPDHLSPEIAVHVRKAGQSLPETPRITLSLAQTLQQATDRLERHMIEHALQGTEGSVTEAAAALGLSRKGLYLKRRRLGLLDPTASN